jgi:hypothetical protein
MSRGHGFIAVRGDAHHEHCLKSTTYRFGFRQTCSDPLADSRKFGIQGLADAWPSARGKGLDFGVFGVALISSAGAAMPRGGWHGEVLREFGVGQDAAIWQQGLCDGRGFRPSALVRANYGAKPAPSERVDDEKPKESLTV